MVYQNGRSAYSAAKEKSLENRDKRFYIFQQPISREWHVLEHEENRPANSIHQGWYLNGEWNNNGHK